VRVGIGKMYVTEYSVVCFTHRLVYLVVFNIHVSTSGSARFRVLIVSVFLIFCNVGYRVFA
jgi:hypothetical protein